MAIGNYVSLWVTGPATDAVRAVLARHGVTPDEVSWNVYKGCEEVFLRLCDELGTQPPRTVDYGSFVGYEGSDKASARRSGRKSVHISVVPPDEVAARGVSMGPDQVAEAEEDLSHPARQAILDAEQAGHRDPEGRSRPRRWVVQDV